MRGENECRLHTLRSGTIHRPIVGGDHLTLRLYPTAHGAVSPVFLAYTSASCIVWASSFLDVEAMMTWWGFEMITDSYGNSWANTWIIYLRKGKNILNHVLTRDKLLCYVRENDSRIRRFGPHTLLEINIKGSGAHLYGLCTANWALRTCTIFLLPPPIST